MSQTTSRLLHLSRTLRDALMRPSAAGHTWLHHHGWELTSLLCQWGEELAGELASRPSVAEAMGLDPAEVDDVFGRAAEVPPAARPFAVPLGAAPIPPWTPRRTVQTVAPDNEPGATQDGDGEAVGGDAAPPTADPTPPTGIHPLDTEALRCALIEAETSPEPESCPSCDGAGCEACEDVCETCQGRGWVQALSEVEACPDCLAALEAAEDPLRALLDAPCCRWAGLPPCPLCGENHGDPAAARDLDADLRAQVAKHHARTEALSLLASTLAAVRDQADDRAAVAWAPPPHRSRTCPICETVVADEPIPGGGRRIHTMLYCQGCDRTVCLSCARGSPRRLRCSDCHDTEVRRCQVETDHAPPPTTPQPPTTEGEEPAQLVGLLDLLGDDATTEDW